MLNPEQTYSRKNQILYDSDGKAVLKFVDKGPNCEKITGVLIENVNKYINRYPERIEIINQEPENEQLTLF